MAKTVYTFGLEEDECKVCGQVFYDHGSLVVTGDGTEIKTNIDDEGSMFHLLILDGQVATLVLNTPTPEVLCSACHKAVPFEAYSEPA